MFENTANTIVPLDADELAWAEFRGLTHLSAAEVRDAIKASDDDLAGAWF